MPSDEQINDELEWAAKNAEHLEAVDKAMTN